MSGRFTDWVSTADAVRSTTGKLAKLAALGAYLLTLDDDDLEIAARLFAGAPFPRTDERVLAVGWRALLDAIIGLTGATPDDVSAAYQAHADLGDSTAELTLRSGRIPAAPPLDLGDVHMAFERIAAARGVGPKRQLLEAMWTSPRSSGGAAGMRPERRVSSAVASPRSACVWYVALTSAAVAPVSPMTASNRARQPTDRTRSSVLGNGTPAKSRVAIWRSSSSSVRR